MHSVGGFVSRAAAVCAVLCLVTVGCEHPDVERIRSANQTVGAEDAGAARDAAPTATQPATSDRVGSIHDLRQGDCFSYGPESTSDANVYEQVVTASCASDDWDLMVSNTFFVARDGAYPGEDHFYMLGYQECPRSDDIHFPSVGSWESGDRVVACLDYYVLDAFDLEAGDCFRFVDDDLSIERVSCEGQWRYRITAQLGFETPYNDPYPGYAFFDRELDTRCPSDSDSFVYSSEAAWETGTRLMACIQEAEWSVGQSR